jgi:hypothetical protein
MASSASVSRPQELALYSGGVKRSEPGQIVLLFTNCVSELEHLRFRLGEAHTMLGHVGTSGMQNASLHNKSHQAYPHLREVALSLAGQYPRDLHVISPEQPVRQHSTAIRTSNKLPSIPPFSNLVSHRGFRSTDSIENKFRLLLCHYLTQCRGTHRTSAPSQETVET